MVVRARLALFGLLITSPTHALIFDQDDRQYTETADRRFDPIGIVKSNAGIGTGFLVDDCHVLTSRHIISEEREILGASVSFKSMRHPAVKSRGKVVARGNPIFRVHGKTNLDRRDDWMLIRLDVCIGKDLGFLTLASEPIKVGKRYQNAGFPVDRSRSKGLSVDPNCTIHYVTRIGLLHDCAFLPGNSGGPIFDLTDVSREPMLRAVAIGSTGYRDKEASGFTSQTANVATPIAPILPILRQFIDAGS